MRASGTTLDELARKIELMTHNHVCSIKVMAAFIGLGGQIQYLYKTEEGLTVLSPVVTSCP